MEGCVNDGGRLGVDAGPDGGARLTAAPGSGTSAGGTGGGRSLNNWALAGAIVAAKNTVSVSTDRSQPPRRDPKMPSPPDAIAMLFTENAAISSHPAC